MVTTIRLRMNFNNDYHHILVYVNAMHTLASTSVGAVDFVLTRAWTSRTMH